jgi:hypothetical protein
MGKPGRLIIGERTMSVWKKGIHLDRNSGGDRHYFTVDGDIDADAASNQKPGTIG